MNCQECRAFITRDHEEACAIARKPFQGGCLTAPGRIDQDLEHELQRLPKEVTDSWTWSGRGIQEKNDG